MNAKTIIAMAAVMLYVAVSGVSTAPFGGSEMMEAAMGAAAEFGAQFGAQAGFGAGAGAGMGAGMGSKAGMGGGGGGNMGEGMSSVVRREAEKFEKGDRYGGDVGY